MVPISKINALIKTTPANVEFYKNAFSKYKSMRNPLPLLKSAGRLFLLDDPALVDALVSLGVEHIPVQILTDEKQAAIVSEVYYDKIDRDLIEQFVSGFPRDISTQSDNADILSADIYFGKNDLLTLVFNKSSQDSIHQSFLNFIELLSNKACQIGQTGFHSFSSSNVRNFKERTMVRINNLSWSSIWKLHRENFLFPAGHLSFEFKGRILGIDYPLTILQSDNDPVLKRQFLDELMNFRQSSGNSRYFGNGVYIMNY